MKSLVLLAICLASALFGALANAAEPSVPGGTRIVLILAAGGELKGPTTMFDAALASMAKTFAGFDERWVFCDLNHPVTAKLCHALAKGAPAADFTGPNVVAVARSLARRIDDDPTISQLVIAIETHGGPRLDESPWHPVWAADGPLDLKQLSELVAAAERRHLPLAIIDNSCYGGGSLSEAARGACVITQGARHTVAFENVAPNENGRLYSIWNQLGAQVPLETAALGLRSAPGDRSDTLWQLGSPAGLEVYRVLEAAVERVQFFPDPAGQHGSPLDDPQLRWIFRGFQTMNPAPGSPQYMDALGKTWASITGGKATAAQRQLLALIRVAETAYGQWLPTWQHLEAATEAQVAVRSANMTEFKPLLWLLQTPEAELRNYARGDALVAAAREMRATEMGQFYPTQIKILTDGIPKISEWREVAKGPTLRQRIRAAERTVYAELYAALSREKAQEPNACAGLAF